MNNIGFTGICVAMMLVNQFFSAFSQILLKKSTLAEHKSVWKEYLNIRVLAAYGIFVIVLFSNSFAYKGIPYKYGSVLGVTSYVFLMILSRILLKEKIEKNVLLGNFIIIAGILIYSM